MFDQYPKLLVLKDGTPVLLRPMRPEDERELRAFFERIPERERWFRRENVLDPTVIHKWFENMDYMRVLPMVAIREEDGRIIANLSLHRRPWGFLSHIGHIRILVDPAYRGLRLGTWMLLDLVKLAMGMGVEKIVAEFVSGVEDAAMKGVEKLDFFKAAVLERHVKDPEGNYHDLVIMVKNLHKDWSDF